MNYIYTFLFFALVFNLLWIGYYFSVESNNIVPYNDRSVEVLDKIILNELQKNNSFERIFKIEKAEEEFDNKNKFPTHFDRKLLDCYFNARENRIFYNISISNNTTDFNIPKSTSELGYNRSLSISEYNIVLNKNKRKDIDFVYNLLSNKIKKNEFIKYIKDNTGGDTYFFSTGNQNSGKCVSKSLLYFEKFNQVYLSDKCIREIYNGTKNPFNVVCDTKKCLSLEWEFFKNEGKENELYMDKEDPEFYYFYIPNHKQQVLNSLDSKYKKWDSQQIHNLNTQSITERKKRIVDLFGDLNVLFVQNPVYDNIEIYLRNRLYSYEGITSEFNNILDQPNKSLTKNFALKGLRELAKRLFVLYLNSCLGADLIFVYYEKGEHLDCCHEISMRKTVDVLNKLPNFYNFIPNEEFYKECNQEKNTADSKFKNESKIYDVINPKNLLHRFSNFYTLNPVISVKRLQNDLSNHKEDKNHEIGQREYIVTICLRE